MAAGLRLITGDVEADHVLRLEISEETAAAILVGNDEGLPSHEWVSKSSWWPNTRWRPKSAWVSNLIWCPCWFWMGVLPR
ncbi:hypothetical protein RchiOBHm_Chr6g0312881 [Rosa chinensis]|uniref:Uncharacterized protein n=1 Tax=Rosa chinensis TaxID=74649 RepID=A0A2P6Q1Y5_ROSCH|nr:hypothetical protein RchiOBHm_Chr6g0312881 [Rosa chinensis]